MDTNELITINYQQFFLYFATKVMIELDTKYSVSSHHGIALSVIQQKILIAKCIKTKLTAGLSTNSNSKII